MAWTFAWLAPHPPILIPEVGKGHEHLANKTLQGVEAVIEKIGQLVQQTAFPSCLIVLSPHLPYVSGHLTVNTSTHMKGSFAPFGAPQVQFQLFQKAESPRNLITFLQKNAIPTAAVQVEDITVDHGSLVPLYFLRNFLNQSQSEIMLLNPVGLSYEQSYHLGEILRQYTSQQRLALLASGDLSHRLTKTAPAGYHPDGTYFDNKVVNALQNNDPHSLLQLDKTLLNNAGECGLRSVLCFLALCKKDIEVFSYEGPFGVGYCNAFWQKTIE